MKITEKLPWILIGVLAVLFLQQRTPQPEPSPDPEPGNKTAAQCAERLLPEMGKRYAQVFDDAAEQVEQGKLNSDRKLVDFVALATMRARTEARADFDAATERELPDGEIAATDRARVAKMLRDCATAFSKHK